MNGNTSYFTAYLKGPIRIQPIFVQIAFSVGLCSRKSEGEVSLSGQILH